MINNRQLYEKCINKWGRLSQEKMFIEEIGEVLTAWNKKDRKYNGCSEEDFIFELVDLEICLEQMKVIYDVNKDKLFDNRKLYKLSKVEYLLKNLNDL